MNRKFLILVLIALFILPSTLAAKTWSGHITGYAVDDSNVGSQEMSGWLSVGDTFIINSRVSSWNKAFLILEINDQFVKLAGGQGDLILAIDSDALSFDLEIEDEVFKGVLASSMDSVSIEGAEIEGVVKTVKDGSHIKPLSEPEDSQRRTEENIIEREIMLFINDDKNNLIEYGTLHNPDISGEILSDRNFLTEYSKRAREEADIVVVFKDWDSPPSWAYSLNIINDVSGINKLPRDHSNLYGTRGSVMNYIVMPNVNQLRGEESFKTRKNTLAHEIGHNWLMFLDKEELKLTRDRGIHYSSCIVFGDDKYKDPMGFVAWEEIDENTFEAKVPIGNNYENKFSKLSLYLMGLIPKEEVPDMYLIKPSTGSDCMEEASIVNSKFHLSGTKQPFSVEDVINIYGERNPNYVDSKKTFSIQFALVVHQDSNLTQEDLDNYHRFIYEFIDYYQSMTSYTSKLIIKTVHDSNEDHNTLPKPKPYQDSSDKFKCPIPSCAEPPENCGYVYVDDKNSDGCLKYPCGKLMCKDSQDTPPPMSPKIKPIPEPIQEPTCDGCKDGDKCYIFGIRLKGTYCDLSGDFTRQKELESSCDNDFECLTNQCSSGECVDIQAELKEQRSLIQGILDFLKKLNPFR